MGLFVLASPGNSKWASSCSTCRRNAVSSASRPATPSGSRVYRCRCRWRVLPAWRKQNVDCCTRTWRCSATGSPYTGSAWSQPLTQRQIFQTRSSSTRTVVGSSVGNTSSRSTQISRPFFSVSCQVGFLWAISAKASGYPLANSENVGVTPGCWRSGFSLLSASRVHNSPPLSAR